MMFYEIPTDFGVPNAWIFWGTILVLTIMFSVLYFFPNGFTKKEQERTQDEVEYQRWIRGRTGETWDQKE